MNHYELSDQARNLISHYFNKSKEPSSYLSAIEAIEIYQQDKFPKDESLPERLQDLLKIMLTEAEKWDKVKDQVECVHLPVLNDDPELLRMGAEWITPHLEELGATPLS